MSVPQARTELTLIPLPDQLGIGGLWYLGQQDPRMLGNVLLELRAALTAGDGSQALTRINDVIAPAQALDATITAYAASLTDCHEAQRTYGQVAVNPAAVEQITDLSRLEAAMEALAVMSAVYDAARVRLGAVHEQMAAIRRGNG